MNQRVFGLAILIVLALIAVAPATAQTFDNSGGGIWKEYMSFPITTIPAEYAQYRIEINGTTWEIYNIDGVLEASGTNGNFWQLVQSDGDDIRVFDQNSIQLGFWVKQFDYANQKATILVRVDKDVSELNIAYGNPSATKSAYNDPKLVVALTHLFTQVSTSPDVDCHQGVAASENYYYTFHTDRIDKRSKADWSVVSQNTNPFAGMTGVNHVGDGDYYNGKLYVPVEYYASETDFGYQHIAIYDADTLQLIQAIDISAYGHEISSITVVPEDNALYITEYKSSGGKVHKYSLDTFEYLGAITPSQNIPYMQGITHYKGLFFISSEDGSIYVMTKTGEVVGVYSLVDSAYANEGMDIDTNGQLLWLQDDGTVQSVYVFDFEIITYETFEDQDTNEWRTAGASATWTITTEKVKEGSYSLKGDAGTTSGANRMFILKTPLSINRFKIEAWVYDFWDGSTNNPNGIVFHASPDTSGKSYVVELSSGVFKISKFTSTTEWSDIAGQDTGMTSYNNWFKFELIYDGGTIIARLYDSSGSLISEISGTDTDYQTGYVGVRVWRNYGYFDEFVVTKYADPADFGAPLVKTFQKQFGTKTVYVNVTYLDTNTTSRYNPPAYYLLEEKPQINVSSSLSISGVNATYGAVITIELIEFVTLDKVVYNGTEVTVTLVGNVTNATTGYVYNVYNFTTYEKLSIEFKYMSFPFQSPQSLM